MQLEDAYKRIEDLEQELRAAQDKLTSQAQAYEDLQEKIKQQQKGYIVKIQKLEQLVHSSHTELQQSYSLNQKYMQEIHEYKKLMQLAEIKDDHRVERLKNELKEMEEMILKLRQQEKEQQYEKHAWQQEINSLNQRNDILRECLDDVKRELVDARQQQAQQVDKNQSFESEIKALLMENSSLQQTSHRAHYELARLQGNYKAYCRIHHIPSTTATSATTTENMITIASNQIMIREDAYPFDRVFEADTSIAQLFEEVGKLSLT
jgi:chromosome segregation ATPase